MREKKRKEEQEKKENLNVPTANLAWQPATWEKSGADLLHVIQ